MKIMVIIINNIALKWVILQCFYLLYFCILLQLSKIVTIVLTATILNAELVLFLTLECFFQHLVCVEHYILTCWYYKTSLLLVFLHLKAAQALSVTSLQLQMLLSYWKQWMLLCALNLIQSIMFIGLLVRAPSGRAFIDDHAESPVCHLPHFDSDGILLKDTLEIITQLKGKRMESLPPLI